MTIPLKVIDHPLIKHKLSLVRSRSTAPDSFRRLIREISWLMAYELTRDLPLEQVTIDTPVATAAVPMLSGKPPCIVSVLRAGNGMLDGFLEVLPSAAVGHIGLVRDPATLVVSEYYFKMPTDIAERRVIIVDPMLATGHSAVAAVRRVLECGVGQIEICLFARRPGGHRSFASGLSRGRNSYSVDRREIERARIHRPRPGRCRRSSVRDDVAGAAHFTPRVCAVLTKRLP